ncbi:MAG: hypothetical protein GWN01_00185, partial [Nitrosopumilaceae archaeon]|nr:hypothetical protein [Nitrosopumilaceae archaeon]NIX60007.1 hypothetical protein [Nitrosopumilaceae archaeon]
NLAKENFWSGIRDKVSMFKIRGSYGSLGNQEVANYLYINTINVRTNLGYIFGDNRPNYALPPELVSSNLTWENAATINFG